ncbi:MAG: hypothetical protein U0269_13195 [Polyangiales bacterium]
MRARVWMPLSACALIGCMAHVEVPRAPTGAPLAERTRAYNAYRPLSIQYATTVSYGRGGSATATTQASGLLLANGTSVFHAEDLVAMAGERSPMAVAATESANANRVADITLWSGLGAAGVATALTTIGIVSAFNAGASSIDWPMIGTGFGLMIGGSISMIVSGGFRAAANRHREAAYVLYDPSLRMNLGLCGAATQIGDCASGLPTMTQPMAFPAAVSQPAQQGTTGQPQVPPPPPPGQ